jgi:hypothetical protein
MVLQQASNACLAASSPWRQPMLQVVQKLAFGQYESFIFFVNALKIEQFSAGLQMLAAIEQWGEFVASSS